MSLRKDLLVTFLLITVAPFCVFIHFAPLGDFWDFLIACSAVVVCSIVILGWAVLKQKGILFSPFIGYLLGFFIILCLLTVIQKASLADQSVLLVYSMVVALTSLLAMQLAEKNNIQYYDYLAFILFVGGIVESFGAIAIQYRLAGMDYWMVPMSGRMIGFIAQSNQLAIYIMIAFLALSYLTFRRIFHVSLLIVFSLLFGFVLLGSGSRAVLLYLIVTIVITVFCWFRIRDKRFLTFLAGIAALIIGAIIYQNLDSIIYLISPEASTIVTHSTSNSLVRSATSESFRLSEIYKALAMFKDAPLLGVGFGNYAVYGFWMGVDNAAYTISGDLPLHSHNFIAQIMAEFGIVGLLGLLSLLTYIVVLFVRTEKTLQWWLVATVVAVFFINSLLEYVLWRMQFVPLLFLILVPLLSQNYKKIACPRLLSGSITLIIAVSFVLTVSSSLDAYAKSFFYNQDTVLLDPVDYDKFKSATDNLLWGREIRMQEFTSLDPNISDVQYQQKITDETLAWRPFAPVIANKIQLLLLTGQVNGLDHLSKGLARSYPSAVPQVCDYFKNFDSIPNLQGLRVVKKELNCRSARSLQQ